MISNMSASTSASASTCLSGTGHLQFDEGTSSTARFENDFSNYSYSSSSISEIEEEEDSGEMKRKVVPAAAMETIKEEYGGGCSFSSDAVNWEDCIYVAVGKSMSTVDALEWTLKHAVTSSSTVVYLLHVFPETRYIPSPLGKIPINQVSPEQVDSYVAQEESKRRNFLQKFIDSCSAVMVKTDTVLIESDMVAKAILDVIPILNIRKLVLGINKSRKLRSRGGSGIANEIFQKAQGFCEVKVICEGKETSNQLTSCGSGSSSPLASPRNHGDISKENDPNPSTMQAVDQRNNSFSCICFKTKFI